MDGRLFDALEHVARKVRGSNAPFGGIQVGGKEAEQVASLVRLNLSSTEWAWEAYHKMPLCTASSRVAAASRLLNLFAWLCTR